MKAVVQSPVCPLMSEPRRDCPLADEALYGMVVEALEPAAPGYWRVRTPYRYEGYAPADCLAFGDEGAERWAALPKKVVLHKNFCDVMAEPKYQSRTRATLPLGAAVALAGSAADGWQPVELVDGSVGRVRENILDDFHETPVDLPEARLRRRLADTALLYARSPYRWGGKTPLGIDCSGLASMSYLLNGIAIYRDARIVEGFPIHPVRREEMGPGDLLYFPGHVAVYLGEGKYIHSTGKAGSDGVAVNSLIPGEQDYREDLDRSMTAAGSYF